MRHYLCYRAREPITIDGNLGKNEWGHAPWTEDFVDIEGDAKPAPRYWTRVKMLWDDQYLYIAAQMEEPHVWGTLTERDSVIFHDNDFELFLDPDGDNHNYLELEINALGTVWDLLLTKPYRDRGLPLTGWDCKGLQTAVAVFGTLNDPSDADAGWTVEIAIPWKSMDEFCGVDCPPNAGDMWRINFSRVEWDHTVENGRYVKVPRTPEHNWVWSPQGAIDMHRPEEWGVLQFCATEQDEPLEYPGADVRRDLMKVYWAQKEFRKTCDTWATDLRQLGLTFDRKAQIYATPDLYQVSMWDEDGSIWKLYDDSRIIAPSLE